MSLTELQPEWSDPPERANRPPGRPPREEHITIAKMLRENPARWARIAQASNSGTANALARAVRTGRSAFTPEHHFDTVIRKQDDGSWGVWARFLGESGEYLESLRAKSREEIIDLCADLEYKAKSKSDGIDFLFSRSDWNHPQ